MYPVRLWLRGRLFFCMLHLHPITTLFPYTTLFRSVHAEPERKLLVWRRESARAGAEHVDGGLLHLQQEQDRKSTRLNSSHRTPSYAVFRVRSLRERVGGDTEPVRAGPGGVAGGAVERGHSGGAGVLERDDADLERRRGAGAGEPVPERGCVQGGREIGRASCRERVWSGAGAGGLEQA